MKTKRFKQQVFFMETEFQLRVRAVRLIPITVITTLISFVLRSVVHYWPFPIQLIGTIIGLYVTIVAAALCFSIAVILARSMKTPM